MLVERPCVNRERNHGSVGAVVPGDMPGLEDKVQERAGPYFTSASAEPACDLDYSGCPKAPSAGHPEAMGSGVLPHQQKRPVKSHNREGLRRTRCLEALPDDFCQLVPAEKGFSGPDQRHEIASCWTGGTRRRRTSRASAADA